MNKEQHAEEYPNNELATPEEHEALADLLTFEIQGVDFRPVGFPREFTQDELLVYDRIAKERNLRKIEADLRMLIGRHTAEGISTKFQMQQKRVGAVEDHLDDTLRKMAEGTEAWDDEKLERLEDRLFEETEKLKTLLPDTLSKVAHEAEDVEERGNELQIARDDVHLRIAHELARFHDLNPPALSDFVTNADVDSLDNAAELVEVGVTSIPLNREQRRARAKAGRGGSSGSGRSRRGKHSTR